MSGKKHDPKNKGLQQINRTRARLPTKRKKQRRDETKTAVPPPEQLDAAMSRARPQRGDGMISRGRGRGGLGHSTHGNARQSHPGFSMREEAINTNDNYYARTWLQDKRSTLRYQGITFVESGSLHRDPTPPTTDNEVESAESPPVETASTMEIHFDKSVPSTARMATPGKDEDTSKTESQPSTSSNVPDFKYHELDLKTIPEPSSNPTVPLPPIQFIPTEEEIVFTPRNERQRTIPNPALTNWELPSDMKPPTRTAPDWTKPSRKKGRGGHKKFRRFKGDDQSDVEFIPPIHNLPMTITAEDALQDYLENIRGQGNSDDDEYIDMVLGNNGVENAMEVLSLDGEDGGKNAFVGDQGRSMRSRSVETRHVLPGTYRHPIGRSHGIPRSALSESATPLRVGSPEGTGPVNSVVDQNSEIEISDVDKIKHLPPILQAEDPDEEDTWILNPESSESESESSANGSDAFDAQGDLLHDHVDPVWNTDSEGPRNKGKQVDVESESEDDSDDELLEEDEEIIAKMILDDYNLEGLDLDGLDVYPPSTRFARKSLTRQPNVPVLPSADEDIATHLQSIWKRDRESKKQRKQDREKARVAGILGKKGNSKSKGKKAKQASRKEEMDRVDALEGGLEVDIRKVNDEMRMFWEDEDATDFALPPMHRFARKIVHTLANAYNLSSKSHGSGKARFTMLFKTSLSMEPLDERKIHAILKRTSWVAPTERSGAKWDLTPRVRGIKKARDGDVVGGDAKEISSDNRGRVMLEKLGWRSGMGLGVEGMGMKLPVFAVIKVNKSGLQ